MAPTPQALTRRRQIGGLAADLRVVDLLEQAFLAADRQFVALDLDDVPGGGATLHLGAQHADAAVPGLVVHRERRLAFLNGSK